MLQAVSVALTYGDQVIFDDVSLTLGAGERVGLIGENGSGKTSLLRVLAGELAPSSGEIRHTGRVAYLSQQAGELSGTVLEAVKPAALRQAAQRYAAAIAGLTAATPEALAEFAEAEEAYRAAGGYDWEAQAGGVLAALGLDAQAQADALSGGQTRRLLLASLLLAPAEIYLLDEPTNHLDVAGLAWLEGWMRASPAAFIFASHDRAFLDNVSTHTAELERGRLTLYPAPYTAAMALREAERAAQERDFEAYRRKRAALEQEKGRLQSVARSAGQFNHARAGNVAMLPAKNKAQAVSQKLAGQARALERRVERLDAQAVAKPFSDHRRLTLDLPPIPAGPSEVLRVEGLTVQRGERVVLDRLNLHVRRGEKVALVGENGAGKSTLLRAILGELPLTGRVVWGAGLSLYAAGQNGEELTGFDTLAQALLEANEQLTPHQLYEITAQLHLPPPSTPISHLSGGQRTRLSLARLSVTRAQVLLLDEPTNHLDPQMVDVLDDVLRDYAGTVLLATHDRRLIERVAGRVVRLDSLTAQMNAAYATENSALSDEIAELGFETLRAKD